MRHHVLSLALIAFATISHAFEIEDHRGFGADEAIHELRIISTADIDVFEPIVERFLEENPRVSIEYTVASSAQIMQALTVENASFDIVISSAMDLQTKLANDGFSRAHRSSATQELPEWAKWRDHLFAFTQEPAAIVVSRKAFDGLPLPRTRQELITVLRDHPDRFRGRIGTYDLRTSGLGYLFATQDARTSETFWRLTEVMGGLDPKLFCCSSDMIDAVASEELAVAYNVLGSYALARRDEGAFEILLPQDFTTVMLRTALVPQNARDPELAGSFIDHLLQFTWNTTAFDGFPFSQFNPNATPQDAHLRRIRMGPGLLVYLDQYKKRIFQTEWERAILQN
ncbi:ABC transporter substrate-binding protein [Primorskyibacter sp. S87]|uniref:ABC transporter substrate-binding protein n=1 Tax=Primorskyibacter sp. S87 TaxID=3415126 RepID=UPI003C7DDED1